MVKRLWALVHREQGGLHEAAYLLGAFALGSQALGLLRDRLFAASFGAGEMLDAYFAAFRIPDLILIGAASLVSASILVPFLIERKGQGGERALVNSVFSVFFAAIVAVSIVAFFAAPFLIRFFFPSFAETPGLLSQILLLTRIMLLQPILLGISNLFGSIVQAERRFFVYAVSPLLYNVGIMTGIILLYPRYGIAGLAWGVVLGALLHLLVQVPTVRRIGLLPRLTHAWRVADMRRIALHSLPRALALGAGNITTLFLVSLASGIGAGSVAIFTLALNLQSVPLSIVGVSYSLAAFPTLTRLAAERDKFLEAVSAALSSIVFWSLPASVLFVVLRAQMVRVVLGAGAFDWTDTRLTAAALALFAISVVAQGATLLFVRAFYATGNSWRPLVASAAGGILAVLAGYAALRAFTFVPPFRFFMEALLRVPEVSGTASLALPLAYSLGVFVTLLILARAFTRRFGGVWESVRRPFFESVGASVIGGAAAYGGLNVFDTLFNLQKTSGIFLQGLFAGLVGIVAWLLVLRLLGSRELATMWATVHQKIWRTRPLAPDPADNPAL